MGGFDFVLRFELRPQKVHAITKRFLWVSFQKRMENMTENMTENMIK
jgi:hypothetical protein